MYDCAVLLHTVNELINLSVNILLCNKINKELVDGMSQSITMLSD